MTEGAGSRLRVAGLFAGIGGIELGLHNAGHVTELLCELEPAAQVVLHAQFPGTEVTPDVRKLRRLPKVDLVAAGFPCQDLSQAGRTAGIGGEQSGLVQEVFRLLERSPRSTWLLLENVPFMLQLERGRAMRHLIDELEAQGFRWAYRVVDTRSTGLPQRRRRVLLLASRTEDPRAVLLSADQGVPRLRHAEEVACGFYWTEGLRGLGWAVDAVPTLKGGSTIGIASPPAIWNPSEQEISTPDLRDAERLQGFPADWTLSATTAGARIGVRWKLVGNAVSVPIAEWLGRQLASPGSYAPPEADIPIVGGSAWPTAAWGEAGRCWQSNVSEYPIRGRRRHLLEFLRYPTRPLSARATEGFLRRANRSGLRFVDGFLADVVAHLERMGNHAVASA